MIRAYSTNKLDLFNKNGVPLCHAFGCRRHVRLVQCFGEIFCKKHARELEEIRQFKTKEVGISDEIAARTKEMLFRKTFDANHVYYLIKLEKHI